ncbi:hypothetical protein SpCBS45565_g04730 [Spizellomyces sp. 'palustris']|nr:hypothetical protein SpCBS45565_g04730 [Spizellomyces sp. 'palustris']
MADRPSIYRRNTAVTPLSQRTVSVSINGSFSELPSGWTSAVQSARPKVTQPVKLPPSTLNEIISHLTNDPRTWSDQSGQAEPPLSESAAQKAFLISDAWPKLGDPQPHPQAVKQVDIRSKLSGIVPSNALELDDLNSRIRQIAAKLRLTDPETELRLAVDSEDSDTPAKDDLLTSIIDPEVPFSSIFLTEVPRLRSDGERELSSPLMAVPQERSIEHAKFPGVQETPHSLPNGVAPKRMLLRVLQSRTQRRRLRQKFMKTETECILMDCFWYMFLHFWQPKAQVDKDKLFARISQNYVHLLLNTGTKEKDDFCSLFPDVMSQAVYVSFCECFPDSIKQFDEGFQTNLCDVLSEWMNGLKPTFPTKWKPIGPTVSGNGSKSELKLEGQGNGQEQSFLDAVMGKSESMHGDLLKQDAVPSCPIGPGPQTHRVWFDANRNSGIVERYLGKAERRTLKIHRAEIIRETLLNDNPTYRQVILESLRRSRKLQRTYKLSQEEAQREKNRLLQSLNEQLTRERKRIWKILAKPEQVKASADQIVDDIQKLREKTPTINLSR